MAGACNAWGEALTIDGAEPATGQEWFDAFRSNAESLSRQFSDEDLKKYYPASWLLLQIMDEERSLPPN